VTSPTYMTHPYRVTPYGMLVLRVRLSLHETQDEFAQRFRVSKNTVSNWERGFTRYPQKIHKEILDMLFHNLGRENKLIPQEQVLVLLREALEARGSLDA
jgi:transcriptional regulator with XRE-family HTH domain